MKTRNLVIALGMVSSLAFLACSEEEGADGVNGVDGTSCYAKALKDSSGFELYCGDEYVGTLKNGEDGAKGDSGDKGDKGLSAYEIAVVNGFKGTEEEWIAALKGDKGNAGAPGENGKNGLNGENGKNGTSCTVEPLATKDGYKVICAGDSVGVVLNGLNGTNGTNGTNGENGLSAYESAVANGFTGSIEEWYESLIKYICGGQSYNPNEKFCFMEELYDKCGGLLYNPDKQFCVKFSGESEEPYDKCGGQSYDPNEKFCFMEELYDNYDKCGGLPYDPDKQFCAKFGDGSEKPYDKCGGQSYDPNEKFCFMEELYDNYDKCGGLPYDPDKQFCLKFSDELEELYDKCGGLLYNPYKQFCLKFSDELEKIYDKCGGSLYDPDKQFCAKFGDESEQVYKMVTIGSQTWMAENLNYEIDGSYCYNDSVKYCKKYGRLYIWAAAMVACPEGWHLPTEAEFETLFKFVGAQENGSKWENAGKMLKSTNGWNEYEGKDGNGNDAFGFSALPAGFFEGSWGSRQRYYRDEGDVALFWSSTETEFNSGEAVPMWFDWEDDNVYLDYMVQQFGVSVRCLKDAQAE